MSIVTNYKINNSTTDLGEIFAQLNPSTSPYIWTQQTTSGNRQWHGIASSSDGTRFAIQTNYTVNGQDLNQIFAPYVSGPKAIETEYSVSGYGDLNNILAPI